VAANKPTQGSPSVPRRAVHHNAPRHFATGPTLSILAIENLSSHLARSQKFLLCLPQGVIAAYWGDGIKRDVEQRH
jgi:hypothetical protein